MKKYLIITNISNDQQTSILVSDKVYDSLEDAKASLSKRDGQFEGFRGCGFSVSSAFTEIDLETNAAITTADSRG